MRIVLSSFLLASAACAAACSDNTTTLGVISASQPGGGNGGASGASAGSGASPGPPASGGTSAAAGTNAGGGPSVAGSGGLCNYLRLDEAPRGIDHLAVDSRRELAPVLVPGDDGESATLAFHWTSYPGGTVVGLRYLPFSPFGAWPDDDFGPPFGEEPYDLQPPIAADASLGGGVSVLAYDPGLSAETGTLRFLPSVSAPFASAATIAIASLEAATPAFVARGKGTHYIGYSVLGADAAGQPKARLSGGRVTNGVYVKDSSFEEQGCGTSALFADAIPFGDSALVVQSTSRTCCTCDDGVDGPPTKAIVRVLGGERLAVLDGDAPIHFVKALSRPEGAWIVVGRSRDELSESWHELFRLSADGQTLVSEQGVPTGPSVVPRQAAAFGDDLVVVGLSGADGNYARLDVRILSPGGATNGYHGKPVSLGPFERRRPTLLANAAGNLLVVAWSLPSETEPGADRVRMLRLARACYHLSTQPGPPPQRSHERGHRARDTDELVMAWAEISHLPVDAEEGGRAITQSTAAWSIGSRQRAASRPSGSTRL